MTPCLIDTSKSVTEPERQGANGLTTLYCMTQCPECHVKCGQKRGAWCREQDQWREGRTCSNSKCGAAYTVPLLPFEVRAAKRIFADPDFGKARIGSR